MTGLTYDGWSTRNVTQTRRNARPTSTTDARVNVTAYTSDSTHGGPLTETGLAPSEGAPWP